jgi:hypothetical protein
LCGAPVRHLLAPIRRGERPRGKLVCQTCLMLHIIDQWRPVHAAHAR